ncbi:hypothetical protein D3C84_867350 [compost metagenome]
MLKLGIDRVLVDRRLHRRAVLQRCIGHVQALGINVSGVGLLQREGAVLDLVVLRRQHGCEIKVAGLVVRRVGVGNVVGQYFGALGTQAQCLLVNAKCLVETDAHVGKPLRADLIVRWQSFSKPHANRQSPLKPGLAP